jgi:hypothetical protein
LVYYKSLVVVALCTAFVIGFYAVLQYEAAEVGTQQTSTADSARTTTCPPSDASCVSFSIASPSLKTLNYSSELGPGSFSILAFSIRPAGGGPIQRVSIFLNNTFVETVQGPFDAGVTKVVNFTLPATVSITYGKAYVLSVEGFYGLGSGATWQAIEVQAS